MTAPKPPPEVDPEPSQQRPSASWIPCTAGFYATQIGKDVGPAAPELALVLVTAVLLAAFAIFAWLLKRK